MLRRKTEYITHWLNSSLFLGLAASCLARALHSSCIRFFLVANSRRSRSDATSRRRSSQLEAGFNTNESIAAPNGDHESHLEHWLARRMPLAAASVRLSLYELSSKRGCISRYPAPSFRIALRFPGQRMLVAHWASRRYPKDRYAGWPVSPTHQDDSVGSR